MAVTTPCQFRVDTIINTGDNDETWNIHVEALDPYSKLVDSKVIPVERDHHDPTFRAAELFCEVFQPWTYSLAPTTGGSFIVTVDVPVAATRQHRTPQRRLPYSEALS